MFVECRQLSEQVWLLPRQAAPGILQANIGFIQTNRGVVIVDAGNSPRHARRLLAECQRLGLEQVETLIYTHHHWDHVFGGMVLNARQIIAHQRCYEALTLQAARNWNRATLEDDSQRNPVMRQSNDAILGLIEDWRSFQIMLPQMRFETQLTLHYDDLQIELVHVGGVHAADSIIVRVPQAGVMFLGDSYYPPPYYERTDERDDLDLAMLQSFLLPGYDVFVDGHGDPRTADEMRAMIAAETQRQQET